MRFVPGLAQSHDKVSLIFLDGSEIYYFNKSEDPWLAATTPLQDETGSPMTWLSDEPAGVLGCASKRMLCKAGSRDSDECVSIFGLNKTVDGDLKTLWPDLQDRLFLAPLVAMLDDRGSGVLEDFYRISGAPSLLTRKTLMVNCQAAVVPPDRWQEEVTYLYRTALATMQVGAVEYARGFWSAKEHCNAQFPCKRLCHSQVSSA